jgi:hypothetical protein
MKRFVRSVAALTLLIWAVGQAQAGPVSAYGGPGPTSGPGSPIPGDPAYIFTYSDLSGDAGYGVLNAVPDGLGDDGLHAISGSLTVTSSAGGLLPLGTYPLLTAGPGVTTSPSGNYVVDNLIYPANDAGSGANNGADGFPTVSNPSYLDFFGLLFGKGGTEVNIYGNGGGDYAFLFSPPGVSGAFAGGTFSLALPEPGSLTLLGIGAAGLLGHAWRRRRAATAGTAV